MTYTVRETIHHGQYRHTAEHSAGTLAAAVNEAVNASPYNAAMEVSKRVALTESLNTTGVGFSGWARYHLVERPDGDIPPPHHPDNDQRSLMTELDVTLDGRPARIRGWKDPQFGTVYDVADPIRSAEWAWTAIARIVARGGSFVS